MADFTNIPSPPAPDGYDKWPTPPFPEQLCWTDSLPDAPLNAVPNDGSAPWRFGTLKDQTLAVYGKYDPLFSATVTRETSPLKRRISVTTGTTTTFEESTTIGLSFGVSIKGIFEMGAKIDQTIGFSQAWTESKTTEDEFTITAVTDKVSAMWWQVRYRYVVNATLVIEPWLPSIIADAVRKQIGSYPKEVMLDCDTYSTSQYPPQSSLQTRILKSRVIEPR